MSDSNQVLTLANREKLSMNGILRVLGFDSDYVLLESSVGKITVEGEELAIESLVKESGEVLIVGSISGIFYSDNSSVRKGPFWRSKK